MQLQGSYALKTVVGNIDDVAFNVCINHETNFTSTASGCSICSITESPTSIEEFLWSICCDLKCCSSSFLINDINFGVKTDLWSYIQKVKYNVGFIETCSSYDIGKLIKVPVL